MLLFLYKNNIILRVVDAHGYREKRHVDWRRLQNLISLPLLHADGGRGCGKLVMAVIHFSPSEKIIDIKEFIRIAHQKSVWITQPVKQKYT